MLNPVEYQPFVRKAEQAVTGQKLTFGFYRVLKLTGDGYQLVEEGAFFDDDLPVQERKILESYVNTADMEVKICCRHEHSALFLGDRI